MAYRTLAWLPVLFLAAFLFHSIDTHHHHPEELFGTGISAFMHATDRKWLWLAFVVIATLFFVSIRASFRRAAMVSVILGRIWRGPAPPRFLASFFSSGVLHPKLYPSFSVFVSL